VVRIHYELPEDLHRRAKAAAAMDGLTLREFLMRALEQAIETSDSDRGQTVEGREPPATKGKR
jgi:hypothetical protein